MSKPSNRVLIQLILIVFLIVSCKAENSKTCDIKSESFWDTFLYAMKDEMVGQPSEKSLAKTKHFSQAGIEFDYPAPLRLRKDSEDTRWSLSYGDFELDIHATEMSMSADDILDIFADTMGSSDEFETKGLENGRKVNWCGQEIQGTVVQLSILGDVHKLEGYDLPAPEGESRFMIFDDIVKKKASKVAKATFSTIESSIRCKYREKM